MKTHNRLVFKIIFSISLVFVVMIVLITGRLYWNTYKTTMANIKTSLINKIGIEQLKDITFRVKAGSGEMLKGSGKVITESGQLSRITEEVKGSMNDMAIGVEEITIAVNRINELSQTNKASIDVLSLEVGKFKV